MNRRTFLAAAATGLGTALAGCNSISGGGGGGGGDSQSLPAYHTSVPAEADGDSGLVYLNVDGLFDLGFLEGSTDTETPTETPTPTTTETSPSSALVSAPVGGSIFATLFGLGFGLGNYGELGARINDQFDAESVESPDDVDLSSVLFVSNAIVLSGEFDTESYADDLPDSFSETDSREGFTVYEASSDGSGAVAIAEEALVVGGLNSDSSESALAGVERVLDTRAGETDRFVERGPDADWTLRQAGSHDFVVASTDDSEVESGESDEQNYDPVAGTPLASVPTTLVVSGASVQTSGGEPSGAVADTALTHTGDSVEKSAIEESYTDSDADISVTVDEGEEDGSQRVAISGQFSFEESLV